MSRFQYVKPKIAFAKAGIYDELNNEIFDFEIDRVLDLLNSLNDENQRLKRGLE